MKLEKIKTPGLAHLSYFLVSSGKALVVDPRRDIACYLKLASQHGCRITHIFETHRNEDLVSGAPILAEATDAKIYHGPNTDGEIHYAETVTEGDQFDIGGVKIKVLETPGHTKDSVSYLVYDKQFDKEPVAIFTGDTLFIGDVGRTDFYPDEMESSASSLFDSLLKIIETAKSAIVLPAHGAGSVCGGGLAEREFSTVSFEENNNPSLQSKSKESFVDMKVSEFHLQPPYFKHMEHSNSTGASAIARKNIYIDWQELESDLQDKQCIVLDIRSPEAYSGGHIPGSYCLSQSLLTAYAGWLFDWRNSFVLVGEDSSQIEQAMTDLQRIGYDNIKGAYHFDASVHAAKGNQIESLPIVTAQTIKQRLDEKSNQWMLLDVRKKDEVENTKIKASHHIFLGDLIRRVDELDKTKPITVMCQSGKRATVGAGILLKHGFLNVDVFSGSMGAWEALS